MTPLPSPAVSSLCRLLLSSLAALVLFSAASPTAFAAQGETASELLREAELMSPATSDTPAQSQLAQIERDKQREHERLLRKEENKRLFAPLVAIAGVLSLLVVNYLLINRGNGTGGDLVSATALVLIVFGTLFVVVIADSDQQLTAAVGILGAVAGYMFGSTRAQQASPAAASRKNGDPDEKQKT